MINKKAAFLLIFTFLNLLFSASGDAGQEIAILEIGSGAHAIALGSAYVAHNPDATSLYWNPAALAYLQNNELATMQNKLASEANYYFLGGAFPTEPLNWGLSWAQVELPDIPETSASLNNNEVEILNELTYQADVITLGGGKMLGSNLALGGNIKYISKKISESYGKSEGYAFGLGLIYQINDKINFGLMGDGIGNYQKYDTGTIEHVPAKLTAGFLFKLNPAVNLLLDVEKRAEQDSFYKGHGGLEFMFNDFMRFGLGYDHDRLTAGAGFQIQNVYADYAYCADNSYNLGAEHFVTLGVKW